MTKMKFIAY